MENSIELFDLPTNVQEMIYGYLGVDEHLSLRRTCKETKAWLENTSLKTNSTRTTLDDEWKKIQYKISESDNKDGRLGLQIKELLDYRLPNMSNFWIENTSIGIYHDTAFQKFGENYCHKIRKLRLQRFFDCASEIEWNFFQTLTNLENLEIEEVSVFLNDKSNYKLSRIPPCLKNLRTLRFMGRVKITKTKTLTPTFNNSWIYNPLKYCPNLEMLKVPAIFTIVRDESNENDTYDDQTGIFTSNVINSLRDQNWSGKLKYLNLRNFGRIDDNPFGVHSQLQDLIDLCESKDVKLLNVEIDLCRGINNGGCVLSVVHRVLNTDIVKTNLPNLESLYVSTHMCWILENREPDLALRNCWPKLKSLSLFLNSHVGTSRSLVVRRTSPAYVMVRLLVDSELRLKLQNFKLRFQKREERYLPRTCFTCPSIIIAQSITTNFPNLINLTLVGWDTEDTEFAHVWEGLPRLETLSIDDCSTASDLAFIGSNINEPSFLKLKSLKKLEMNFTYMPRVTERFFKDVLCHLEVKQLVLRSSSKFPINTVQCISFLLEGKLANNLDKITLDLKGLNELPKDQYIELKKKFRSLR